MDPLNYARKHQPGSVSTTTLPRQNATMKKPAPACTVPSFSAKSSSRDSAWLVRPTAPSPSTAGPSSSRRHKRSGFQSGPDLTKAIPEQAEKVLEQPRVVKAGAHSDAGTKKPQPKRGVPQLHLKFTTRPSGSTTAYYRKRAEFGPGMPEVRTSNLAVVTPARESDSTDSTSTKKRKREDEVEDGNHSRFGKKCPRTEISAGVRKGILKDPKKVPLDNQKRSVRWAEQLEDYNYPQENFFTEDDLFFDNDSEMEDNLFFDNDSDMEDEEEEEEDETDVEEEDETDVDDVSPADVQDQAQIPSSYSRAIAQADQNNQQFLVAPPPLAVPTAPENWFIQFLATLSPKDVHDLRVACDAFYGPAALPSVPIHGPFAFPPWNHMAHLPVPPFGPGPHHLAPVHDNHGFVNLQRAHGAVNAGELPFQNPYPPPGTFGPYHQMQAGSWRHVHCHDGVIRAAFVPNYHQDQGVPDLSTSPDLSDRSPTPPSLAQLLFNRSPNDDFNATFTEGECNGSGLNAQGFPFPGVPYASGPPQGYGSTFGPPPQPGRSVLGDENWQNGTPPFAVGACLANESGMGYQIGAPAARRIAVPASVPKAVKDGRGEGTEKFTGFEATSGPASTLM